MSSVRVTAAGAVVIATLAFFTAPVSACDDRYVKRCEKAAAAAAAAADAQSDAPVAKRKSARHVRLVRSRHSRRIRMVVRTRAPGFSKHQRGMVLASDTSRPVTMSESTLARRFRGFIDPQPMAQNAFEALRKPHLVALSLEPAPALPPTAPSPAVAPADSEAAPTLADATASVPTVAKQDRIAANPAASAEPLPAVTRQVALTDALAAKPLAAVEATVAPVKPAPPPHEAAPAILTEAPPAAPADPQPSRFPVHQLVLALCGALGAASALRFIVGA